MRLRTSIYNSIAVLGIAGLTAVVMGGNSSAPAAPPRGGESGVNGTPRLAVIALAEQRLSIYGATGKVLEAPVSTGAKGYETPAGIYSILEKQVEHHSNLYDDASMPYMERLTWSGIAMHAGVLPGYPASHGCSRMPYAFARQLYQLTELGMRVVAVREDILPVEIEQPAMFTPRQPSGLAGLSSMAGQPGEAELRGQLQSIAAAKLAEAKAAVRREKEAKAMAAKRAGEAAPLIRALRAAEANLAKAEADLKAAESALATADSPDGREKAEAAKAQAAAAVETARAQLDTAKAQAQAKMDAAAQAQDEAKAAVTTMNRALEAVERAKHNTSPVSVFISRKTNRIYIRKGNYPIFEETITIGDSDKPIGTFVFTALDFTETPGVLRWNVVSMYKNATNIEPYTEVKRVANKAPQAEPLPPADLAGARAALGRLQISQAALERISEVVLPGSSLIVSDEGPSNEIGKDTDFIVFMSGEPQGGIVIRRHARRDRSFGDVFFGGSWRRRSRGGGFFPFFGD